MCGVLRWGAHDRLVTLGNDLVGGHASSHQQLSGLLVAGEPNFGEEPQDNRNLGAGSG
jgi:hypothetical protein